MMASGCWCPRKLYFPCLTSHLNSLKDEVPVVVENYDFGF